ncbi:chain-length determining protein [Phaeobacter sp. J2-8]|uniref:GumC family protein n=1 Tax=Phaeobacter sp. J2-8 TaxID=2931394 RepID=UPI001FD34E3F|nr:chain-length determining protein [Phaeobacter sp. J2-8]MCJ7874261.1 chain-length determining protein [Phaeobacter sp. J2-8]
MNQLGSFSDLKSMIRRRLPLIMLIALLGSALSVYFALGQPKVYEAIAVVQIEDAKIVDSRTGRTDAGHRLQLIEQRMMARDNVIEIIEDFGLYQDVDNSIGFKVALFRELTHITPVMDSAQPWLTDGSPTGLTITVSMSDPQQAADVANELLARIVDQGRSRQEEQTEQALAFFTGEERRLTDDILILERQLAEYKQVHSDSLPTAVTSQRTRLETLRQTELNIDRDIIQLQTNTRRAREGVVEGQIAQLEEQRRLVQERIAEVEAALNAAPRVEQELNILNRDLDQLREQLRLVTTRKAAAQTDRSLQEQKQTERFEVLETALVPEHPVSRSRKKTAVMGGFASVIFALGLAFMLEMSNPAIRSSAQLERALGIEAVVSIPAVSTRRERRLRKLLVIGWILGALALIPAVVRLINERWPNLANLSPFKVGERQEARL